MKLTQAVQHLRTMMWALQKYRSNSTISSIPSVQKMWPWVFGESCPLPALHDILSHYDRTDELEVQQYYNMMTILYRFMPEIQAASVLYEAELQEELRLPNEQPGLEIFGGWE